MDCLDYVFSFFLLTSSLNCYKTIAIYLCQEEDAKDEGEIFVWSALIALMFLQHRPVSIGEKGKVIHIVPVWACECVRVSVRIDRLEVGGLYLIAYV